MKIIISEQEMSEMSEIPEDLMYTTNDEWVKKEADDKYRIGITDHAQHEMNDIVYVELPDVGQVVEKDEAIVVVESVKAASDVLSPFSGEILEVNEGLDDAPETVNSTPYEDGWLVLIKLSDPSEIDHLVDSAAYKAKVEK